jgi:predicted membrane-bound dolichyl-phosphate-mannose-protein mannosyltransferase
VPTVTVVEQVARALSPRRKVKLVVKVPALAYLTVRLELVLELGLPPWKDHE